MDEIGLWQRVVVVDSCWEWVGPVSTKGYGRVRDGGRVVQAHRVFYERLRGPIPAGLTLDHLCRNRRCVNPDHLEPVTVRENVLRGVGITASQSKQTHCVRGHALSGGNLCNRSDGERECRECKRQRDAERDWAAVYRRRAALASLAPAQAAQEGGEG